jgi:hypothetical protein
MKVSLAFGSGRYQICSASPFNPKIHVMPFDSGRQSLRQRLAPSGIVTLATGIVEQSAAGLCSGGLGSGMSHRDENRAFKNSHAKKAGYFQ